MSLWKDPDVFEHVTSDTPMGVNRFTDKIVFIENYQKKDINPYKKKFEGNFNKLVVTFPSLPKLEDKKDLLLMKTTETEMETKWSQRPMIHSYDIYDTQVSLYQIPMFLNNIWGILDFDVNTQTEISVLTMYDLVQLFSDVITQNFGATAMEITNPEQVSLNIKKFEIDALEPEVTIESLMESKLRMTSDQITQIYESPLFQEYTANKLNELGKVHANLSNETPEDRLKTFLSWINTYIKESNTDE